jgi:hypothetical protein
LGQAQASGEQFLSGYGSTFFQHLQRNPGVVPNHRLRIIQRSFENWHGP